MHGRNLVGDTGDVSLYFFRRGDIICHVPPLFSLGFVFREVSKRKVMLVTFCVKSFSLDGRSHSQVDVETVWCGITDFC